MRSALAVFCAILLPCAIAAQDAQYSQSTPPPQAAPVPQQNVPLLSPQQLDNLVAPVALYPDPLLGQVLAASTYPLEVVEAQQWMQENSSLHGSQLMDAAKQQNWDPSVQAMVAFPDVMSLLTRDIRWTTDLGNAFLAQQSDLMAAVQRMRARAEQNGRLSSNAQESVTTATEDGQSAIQIQPADPQVVYVPVYNPEYVWGPPAWGYYPSLWYPPVSYGCGFNAGIFMGGFFAGFGGWGGWGWGLGWFGHGLYVNSLFFNHFGFHGYYGGYGARAMWAHDPMHRMGVAYPNRALSARYGNARFAGGRYNAGFANRGGFSGNRAGAGYNGGFRNGAAGYGNSARAGAGNSYRGGVNRGASSSGSSYRGSNGGSSGYRSFNSAGRAGFSVVRQFPLLRSRESLDRSLSGLARISFFAILRRLVRRLVRQPGIFQLRTPIDGQQRIPRRWIRAAFLRRWSLALLGRRKIVRWRRLARQWRRSLERGRWTFGRRRFARQAIITERSPAASLRYSIL